MENFELLEALLSLNRTDLLYMGSVMIANIKMTTSLEYTREFIPKILLTISQNPKTETKR